MPNYIITSKSDGAELLRYTALAPQDVNGYSLYDYNHAEAPPADYVDPRKYGGRRVITKLEFRSLFPRSALEAIDRFEAQFEAAAFLTDAQKDQIRSSFADYNAAQDVNLDDPRWIPGLGLYVSLGYLTEAEMLGVLNG